MRITTKTVRSISIDSDEAELLKRMILTAEATGRSIEQISDSQFIEIEMRQDHPPAKPMIKKV